MGRGKRRIDPETVKAVNRSKRTLEEKVIFSYVPKDLNKIQGLAWVQRNVKLEDDIGGEVTKLLVRKECVGYFQCLIVRTSKGKEFRWVFRRVRPRSIVSLPSRIPIIKPKENETDAE